MQLYQLFKTIHGWTGALLLPWIVVIGFTGFFLNHRDMLGGIFDQRVFEPEIKSKDLTIDQAAALVSRVLPASGLLPNSEVVDYHEKEAFSFTLSDNREIIVEKSNGLVHDKTPYTRTVYDRKGKKLDKKIYWQSIFKQLHTDGWLGGRLGSTLSDIVSIAMIGFGLSSIYLFLAPRIRRRLLRKRIE